MVDHRVESCQRHARDLDQRRSESLGRARTPAETLLPHTTGALIISGSMRRAWLVLLLLWLSLSTAQARTVTGYTRGHKTKIKLVKVDGVELEARTARAFRRMANAARKAGIYLGIRSGFRSHEKQTELYERYRRGWGNLAARPGYSNHQNGRAVDIFLEEQAIYAWLKKHAHRFGFKQTVKREPWHWEYQGKRRRAEGGAKTRK